MKRFTLPRSAIAFSVPVVKVSRWVWIAVLACAIGGFVSLLIAPSALINDPNWWVVWAGDLPSGTIDLTGQGNVSWKPLPVLLTVPASAISQQIGIHFWLWVSRSCVLGTSVLLYRLASRRGGPVGGIVAALLPLLIQNWDQSMVGGASEPLLMVLILSAVEAALSNRRWLALWLAVLAALVRPEVSPLLLIYGVWLLRRDRSRALVPLAAGVLVLAIGWFALPALLMGNGLQAAETTTVYPGPIPWIGELFRMAIGWTDTFWWTLVPLAAGLFVAVRERDRLLLWLIAGAGIWTLTLVAFSAGGVSGMPRYTVPPMIALCVVAGAGAGAIYLACRPLALRVAVVVALIAALGLSINANADRIGLFFDLGHYQLLAVDEAAGVVRAAGGASRFKDCQPLGTNASLGYPGPLGPRLGLNVRSQLKPAKAPTILIVGAMPVGVRANAVGKPPGYPEGEVSRKLIARRGLWSVYYVAGKRDCRGFTR
ncbi:MAG: hypothetical protein WCL20_04040 [Actinomycetes bacterium]